MMPQHRGRHTSRHYYVGRFAPAGRLSVCLFEIAYLPAAALAAAAIERTESWFRRYRIDGGGR